MRKLVEERQRRVAVCGFDGAMPLVGVENLPGEERFKDCGTRNISSDPFRDKTLGAIVVFVQNTTIRQKWGHNVMSGEFSHLL